MKERGGGITDQTSVVEKGVKGRKASVSPTEIETFSPLQRDSPALFGYDATMREGSDDSGQSTCGREGERDDRQEQQEGACSNQQSKVAVDMGGDSRQWYHRLNRPHLAC